MVVATYAHFCTPAEKVTSYRPMPMWATVVTPLPCTSWPLALTLANRLPPAACADAAPMAVATDVATIVATAAPAASLVMRWNMVDTSCWFIGVFLRISVAFHHAVAHHGKPHW